MPETSASTYLRTGRGRCNTSARRRVAAGRRRNQFCSTFDDDRRLIARSDDGRRGGRGAGGGPFAAVLPTVQSVNLCLAQQPEADQLLSDDPFALLVGMVLDQQIPLEVAFAGPKKIADRMGGFQNFSAGEIADYDPDKFAALCSERPAIHRFPGSMAKRIQALAQIIVDRYDGDAAALWMSGDPDGKELLQRLKGLPGFGEQKAQIFLALLGKQYGVTPKGWRAAAGEFGKAGTHVSVADIVDAQSLGKVRSYKKEMKAAAKAAKQ